MRRFLHRPWQWAVAWWASYFFMSVGASALAFQAVKSSPMCGFVMTFTCDTPSRYEFHGVASRETGLVVTHACDSGALAALLKEVIADLRLSDEGYSHLNLPFSPPIPPAEILRQEAAKIEAKDALLRRARELVKHCAP